MADSFSSHGTEESDSTGIPVYNDLEVMEIYKTPTNARLFSSLTPTNVIHTPLSSQNVYYQKASNQGRKTTHMIRENTNEENEVSEDL